MSDASKRSKKTTVGAALLGSAALLAGVGAFASFSDTETVTRNVDAGQLDIVVTPETATVQDMAPGDIWSQPMEIALPDLTNDGNLIESIRLETAARNEVLGLATDTGDPDPGTGDSSSIYFGDAGLRLVIQNCDGGTWTDELDGTFSCDGDVIDVVGDASDAAITRTGDVVEGKRISDYITGSDNRLTAADFGYTTDTIPDGASLNLLVTLALPGDNLFGNATAADNSYEGASINLDYVFTAIQRAGIEK